MIQQRRNSGFTLVEILIGMSLSLMVLTAVLSSYLFMGRNLVRLVNQQTLETESRRALQYFSQDVRMAISLSNLTTTSVTFTIPTSTGTTTVAYNYDSNAGQFTRTTPANTGTLLVLVNNIKSGTFSFAYYNIAGNQITQTDTQVSSPNIRRISYSYDAQTGNSGNGTLTALFRMASSRLSLRNKTWSP
jgi:prepilin-type N-terminal cleavage/methylation domain-containing protein